MAFRGQVTSVEWIGAIDAASGEILPLDSFAADQVSTGAGSSLSDVVQDLLFGVPQSSNGSQSEIAAGGGRPDIARSFEPGDPVYLGNLQLSNSFVDLAQFGGGVVRYTYEFFDQDIENAPVQTATIELAVRWSDTDGATDGAAPDRLTIMEVSSGTDSGIEVELLGFSDGGDLSAGLQSFDVDENNSASAALYAQVSDTMVTPQPDFAIEEPPVARIEEGPVLGVISNLWGFGDSLTLTQEVQNVGNDTGGRVGANFLLLNGADTGTVTPFRKLGELDAVPILVEPGETGELSVSIAIDELFLDRSPPGWYRLIATLDTAASGDANPENDTLPDGVSTRILVASVSVIEIAADATLRTVDGTPLDDTIVIEEVGDTTVEGGDGQDTAIYERFAPELEATIQAFGFSGLPMPVSQSLSDTEAVVITDPSTGMADTLASVERVGFLDGTLLFDLPGAEVPFSYRLYSAAFARTPDEGGLRFWNDQRNDGLGDRAMANAFVGSPEFADKFGANPTDEEFIAALYGNVLLRAPDEGGEAFWLDAFASGRLDRADMLLAFSESSENTERNAENYDIGVWVV